MCSVAESFGIQSNLRVKHLRRNLGMERSISLKGLKRSSCRYLMSYSPRILDPFLFISVFNNNMYLL